MDKDDTIEIKKPEAEEKSLNELKEELSRLLYKLEMCQVKFIQLNQQEEVRSKQEMLLKVQAHDLNKIVVKEQTKLDDARRNAEEHVEGFIQKINCALEKEKCMLEASGDSDEKKRKGRHAWDKRRKRYCELKGEMEALLLYKEYQECVMDEIQRIENSRGLN